MKYIFIFFQFLSEARADIGRACPTPLRTCQEGFTANSGCDASRSYVTSLSVKKKKRSLEALVNPHPNETLRLGKETELLCSRARMGLLPLCWKRLKTVCLIHSVLGALHNHTLNYSSGHVFIHLLKSYCTHIYWLWVPYLVWYSVVEDMPWPSWMWSLPARNSHSIQWLLYWADCLRFAAPLTLSLSMKLFVLWILFNQKSEMPGAGCLCS